MSEVYADRGIGPLFRHETPAYCSRCGERVVGTQRPDTVFVCTDCLHATAPEISTGMPAEWHPDSNPMHCATCYFKLRR